MNSSYEDSRLRLWSEEIEKQTASLRARRDRLAEDHSICLQLEASLIELTHENDATAKTLQQQERHLIERKFQMERRIEELSNTLSQAEENLRHQKERQENVGDQIDSGWRQIEEELKSLDSCHAYEVSRLRKAHRELEDREGMLRERIRTFVDREQSLLSTQRKLQTRQTLLGEIARQSIERLVAELQEREALLHNEEFVQ